MNFTTARVASKIFFKWRTFESKAGQPWWHSAYYATIYVQRVITVINMQQMQTVIIYNAIMLLVVFKFSHLPEKQHNHH